MFSPSALFTGRRAALACLVMAVPWAAQAQVTMTPDGKWRSLFTTGASVASGNTESTSLSFGGDLVRLRNFDKWSFMGQALYSKAGGTETANRVGGSGLYTRDVDPTLYGFGQLDVLRDLPSNLALRAAISGGLGLHMHRSSDHTWDVSTGLGYTRDRYDEPDTSQGAPRSREDYLVLALSEESTHKFTQTTSFKQRLAVTPRLNKHRDWQLALDSSLSVAMTQQLSLTASLSYRYDNTPSEGFGNYDTLLITGVSLRFD